MARVVKVGKERDSSDPLPDKFEKERKDDAILIKGIFNDNECRGGSVEFPFHKWPGDPEKMYRLVDGHQYELPKAVVKHLNSNCFYEQDSYSKDLISADGMPMKNPNPKRIYRFSFKPLEYT